MSYKSILTLLDNSAECRSWTKFAIELAKQHGARLVGVASREIATSLSMGEMVSIDSAWIVEMQDRIDKESQTARASFETLCKEAKFKSFEVKEVTGSEEFAVRHEASNNDLIVVGQHYEGGKGTRSGLIESLLLSTGRPVLIVPAVGEYTAKTKKVLVAWRNSRESSLAVRQAIPQLKNAKSVEIVSIDSHKADKRDEEKLQDLVKYLALNDIDASYKFIVSKTDTGNVLLSHACDYDANLLVMGGYGHTRLKEWALGGTTRTILQTMTLPILMSH